MKYPKAPAKGDLVFSDIHGPGIVTDVFTIRKSQPRMLTVLFDGTTQTHIYETKLKVLQRVERKEDGTVSIIFDRNSS